MNIDLKNPAKKALVNALLIGGIASFSSLTVTGGLPTIENLWAGFVAGALACLIRLKDFIENSDNSNVPKEYRKDPPKLGMLL